MSPVSSETRSPVWTASRSSAWSRRPVQVVRSGAASSASISGSVRKVTSARSKRLGGIASTRWIVRGVLGVAQRGVAEQRVDRGQPGVAGADAVAALVFEVVEERADQRRVEVGEVELGWAACRCAARRRRAAAGACRGRRRSCAGWRGVADQPVGEERLQGRGERAHRPPPAVALEPLGRRARAAPARPTDTSRCAPGRRARGRWTAAAAGPARRRRRGTSRAAC